MDQVHVIRHKIFVEKKSMRQVAVELGVSRNTVRKYVGVSEPKRRNSVVRPHPVRLAVTPRIDALLLEWSGRTTAKQRVTAALVHRHLQQEGHKVSKSFVRQYMHDKRLSSLEVYVPLIHLPGDEAQIDFFEVTIDVAGQRRKAWKFLMRLMYSKRDFAWVYDHCDQVSFLDGHVRAFAHFGGVPKRCIYDNLSAAVRKVLPRRQLTQRFMALVSHYLFEPCFARVGEGHDKGGVESRGKSIRLQHLTPIPMADTLTEINNGLMKALDSDCNMERFKEDFQHFLALNSSPFEASSPLFVTVQSNATVRVAKSTYSVPSSWARRQITALVGPETIRFILGEESITRVRVHVGGKNIRYRDYLPVLATKPQALRQVMPALLPELPKAYAELWQQLVDTYGPLDAARVMAKLLKATRGEDELPWLTSLQEACNHQSSSTQNAANVCESLTVSVPDSLAHYHIDSAKAADYDFMLKEVSHHEPCY